MDSISDLIVEALGLVKDGQGQAAILKPGAGPNVRAYLEQEAGHRRGTNMYAVVAPDGKEITRHCHDEDVILFYPRPEGTPVILEIDGTVDQPGEEHSITPGRGGVVFVPKGVWHRVPKHTGERPRVSIALKLED